MRKILKKLDNYGTLPFLSLIVGLFFLAKVYDVMVQFWIFFCFAYVPFLLLSFLWIGFLWIGLILFLLFCCIKAWLTFSINDVPTE